MPMKFLLTMLAAGAAAAAIVAPGAAAARGAIVFRATAVPMFLGPTAACPEFRVVEPSSALRGAPDGAFEFCFSSVSSTPSGGLDATGTVTFTFPDGTMAGTLHLVEIPTTNGAVVQVDSGVVTGGTGAYLDASGRWLGTGPITFDGDGTPHPNLLFAISLR